MRGRGDRAAADPSERCAASRSCISTRRCGPSSPKPCCPASRCTRSRPRRRTWRCGWSSAASARARSARSPASTRPRAQRRANRLAEVVDYVALAGAAGRARPGAGRHLQGLRGGLRGHPRRRDRALQRHRRARRLPRRAAAHRRRPAAAVRTPRWRRSPARCSGTCPRAATATSCAACGCATAAAARCGSGRMPTTRPSCCARRSATTR